MRMCFVCRKEHPKQEMIRFAVSPQGVVVPDISEKLPGRGVWMVPRPENFKKAIEQKMFQKAFKEQVTVPADLVEQVDRVMRVQALNFLGLAKKANVVKTGAEKVKEALAERKVGLILEDPEASAGSKGKLYRPGDDVPILRLFSGAEMAKELGLPNVVFAAFVNSKITTQIKSFMLKYAAFKEESGALRGPGSIAPVGRFGRDDVL